ncbi:MAG: hypothetical protein AB2A00_09870 [Myxococcota bacterium]
MSEHGCRRERIAYSRMGSVELCSCGMCHLTVGALTLRMDPAALNQLAATMTHAAAVLERRRQDPQDGGCSDDDTDAALVAAPLGDPRPRRLDS